MASVRRLNRPAPVAWRPLVGGRLHRPACCRPNPDRPLGPRVERIRRALNAATYLGLIEQGASHERLLPVALRLVVDEFVDHALAEPPGHPPSAARGTVSPETTAPRTNTERPAPPVMPRQDAGLPERDHGGRDAQRG